MLASEFLQPYPRQLTEERIHQGAQFPVVREVQQYSYAHGLIVHAAMNDQPEQIGPLLPGIGAFEATHRFAQIDVELLDTPGAWQYRNQVNFYALNEHMFELWNPLAHNTWPRNRAEILRFSMDSMAFEGLKLYGIRERWVQENRSEELYTDENRDIVERVTGAMQEMDAAIVVMGAMRKHDNITVVPAPLQFERSNPKINADLLVIDTVEKRMVGVQVKSRVTNRDVELYDPERIVLLDGDTDLGNIRVLRTKKGSSKTEVKPWPGIIAASQVHNIKTHGRHQYVDSRHMPYLMAQKALARELVGTLRVDPNGDMVKTIEQRILNKL